MIKNRVQLVENGGVYRQLRADVCDILEAALEAVDPEQSIFNSLRLDGEILFYEGGQIDLSEVYRVFVIGGGKAGGLMARAVETLLGDHITAGYINILKGTEKAVTLKKIKLNGAQHPTPSGDGVAGVGTIE